MRLRENERTDDVERAYPLEYSIDYDERLVRCLFAGSVRLAPLAGGQVHPWTDNWDVQTFVAYSATFRSNDDCRYVGETEYPDTGM